MKISHKSDYRLRRSGAYMHLPDQIDAIYKGFVAIQSANIPGLTLPQATLDWMAQIADTKNRLPKPSP